MYLNFLCFLFNKFTKMVIKQSVTFYIEINYYFKEL